MNHFPTLPIQWNTISLFGITLLLGLLGGELARRVRFLPKISGYIAIGFLLGPDVLDVVSVPVLATARVFVDISLGLILFDLGRHLDFSWLRHDLGLFLTSLTECSLTFICIFTTSYWLIHMSWLSSALAASFALATSPAVVLMVANDLHSQGPVTRRTITLTSLNNFFALSIFTILLPFTQSRSPHISAMLTHSTYMILGSITVGTAIFGMLKLMAVLIGKHKQTQFVLFIGTLIFTIGIAQLLNVPSALTLFILGVATRNFDFKHTLMEIDFGLSSQLFFILLFVVTGTYLHLDGLRKSAFTVFAFIIVRSLAKSTGVWIMSGKSRLTTNQVISISLALTPMAGLAISMSNVLDDFNPEINKQISTIIAAVVAILEIFGPIATQFAFLRSGEAISEATEQEAAL